MEHDDEIERLQFRADRMKLKADRAAKAQHEASARIDSVEYELEALKREIAEAKLPPDAASRR